MTFKVSKKTIYLVECHKQFALYHLLCISMPPEYFSDIADVQGNLMDSLIDPVIRKRLLLRKLVVSTIASPNGKMLLTLNVFAFSV